MKGSQLFFLLFTYSIGFAQSFDSVKVCLRDGILDRVRFETYEIQFRKGRLSGIRSLEEQISYDHENRRFDFYSAEDKSSLHLEFVGPDFYVLVDSGNGNVERMQIPLTRPPGNLPTASFGNTFFFAGYSDRWLSKCYVSTPKQLFSINVYRDKNELHFNFGLRSLDKKKLLIWYRNRGKSYGLAILDSVSNMDLSFRTFKKSAQIQKISGLIPSGNMSLYKSDEELFYDRRGKVKKNNSTFSIECNK